MLIHKFFVLFLFITGIIVSGCAHSYAPRRWLPDTDQIQTEAFGGWLSIEYRTEIEGTNKVKGEYITSDSANVYLLYDSLTIIPKSKITEAVLEIDDKNTSEYSGWTVLGMISTLSHGLFSVFTMPTWLMTGIIASSGESYRDRYSADDPANEYWDLIIKFARFPQGLPENINPKALRRKEVYSK